MPIAGVVILTKKDKTNEILLRLNEEENITTYGIHKDTYIIAVFESESNSGLEDINNELLKTIPGIVGIYPSYVNYEDA